MKSKLLMETPHKKLKSEERLRRNGWVLDTDSMYSTSNMCYTCWLSVPGNSIQKFMCTAQKCRGGEFPGGPTVWTQCFQCCGQVQSLVGKLHSIAEKQTNKQKLKNKKSQTPNPALPTANCYIENG